MTLSRFSSTGKSGARLGLKLTVIFFIILGLLIPLDMIGTIADERKERARTVGEDIIGMNGGRPSIIGPVLIVPVTIFTAETTGTVTKILESAENVAIFPDALDVRGSIVSEMRRRGIYQVPIFTGDVLLKASFSDPAGKVRDRLGYRKYRADWNHAWYTVDLLDKRSIKSAPLMRVAGGESVPMKGAESSLGWTDSSLRSPVVPGEDDGWKSEIEVTMRLGGGGALSVYPLAGTVRCVLDSDWASPSFTGYVVPTSYEISQKGFHSEWYIPESSRPFPESMYVSDCEGGDMRAASFGVDFFQPVSGYHKTERSLKYGLLFIVVPFIVFFLFELFTRRKIHPLQYLMIGLADVFFYLLLLSLSEHIPFAWAYLIGATVVCLLVATYSSTVLGGWKRGFALPPVLGGIYAYLYIALESEDYALLVGSIGVFAILATVMIATRRVDWYAFGEPPEATPSPEGTSSADGIPSDSGPRAS